MSWNYRSGGTLENARRALGSDLADDPLAQHLALQIETAELALVARVDWLVEKRDGELAKRRAESEETLEDTSFTSPAAPEPMARKTCPSGAECVGNCRASIIGACGERLRLPDGAPLNPPRRTIATFERPKCFACGAEQGTPHAPACAAMSAAIRGGLGT